MNIFTKIIQGLAFAFIAGNAVAQFGSASSMVLLSSTDFSIPSRENEYASSFEDFAKVGVNNGFLKPTITINEEYSVADSFGAKSGEDGEAYSDFPFCKTLFSLRSSNKNFSHLIFSCFMLFNTFNRYFDLFFTLF